MASSTKESFRDRLLLDNTRIDNMISSVQDIINLPDPIGQMLDIGVRPNGLEIKKYDRQLELLESSTSQDQM